MGALRTFLVLGAAFGLSGCLTSPDLLHSGSDMRIPIERAQFSMDLVPGPADGERHIEVTHSRGLYRLRMTPPIDASVLESRAVFLALPGNENRILVYQDDKYGLMYFYTEIANGVLKAWDPGSNLEDLIDAAAPNASFAADLTNPFRNISESQREAVWGMIGNPPAYMFENLTWQQVRSLDELYRVMNAWLLAGGNVLTAPDYTYRLNL